MQLETLTLSKVAAALGVTRRTLYIWIATGRFDVQPIKGTKPRRWRVEDVRAWRNRSDIAANAM